MTVAQLSRDLTQEELVSWAAYFELHNEQQEKAIQSAKAGKGARTMGGRQTGAQGSTCFAVANYNVDIAVAVKAAALNTFNQKLKTTERNIGNINTLLRATSKAAGSFNDLSQSLRTANSNMNEAVRGTRSYKLAILQAARAERELNRELRARSRIQGQLTNSGSGFAAFSQRADQFSGRPLRTEPLRVTRQRRRGLGQYSSAIGPSPQVSGAALPPDFNQEIAAATAAARGVEALVTKTAQKRKSFAEEINQLELGFNKKVETEELNSRLKKFKSQKKLNKEVFDDIIKEDKIYGKDFDRRLRNRTEARKKANRKVAEDQKKLDKKVADARKKVDREAEKARSTRRKGAQSALLGVGFPLLFGGGAGSIAGGLLGSKGGFGGQILGSAIGAQIDAAIEKIKETAKAVSTVGSSFDFLTENSLYSNEETEKLARKLEELGEVEKLAELNAAELVYLIGNDGVQALQDFNKVSGELDSEMAELGLAFDSFMAYYLKPVVDFLNETVGAINTGRRFKDLQEELKGTAAGKKLDEDVKRLQAKNTKEAAEAAIGVPNAARTTAANNLKTAQMVDLLTKYKGQVPVTVDIPEGDEDEPKGSKVDPTINLKRRLGVVNSLIEAEQRVNGLSSEGAGIVRRKLAFERRIAQIRETGKAERQRLTDLEDISLSKAVETNAEKLATLQFEREMAVAIERSVEASQRSVEPVEQKLNALRDRNAFEREYGELIMSGSTPAAAEQVIEAKKQIKEIEKLVEKQLRSNEIQINILKVIVAQTVGTDRHAVAQEALNKALERENEIREKGEKAKGEVKGKKTPAENIEAEIKRVQGELNELIDPANQVIAAAQAIGDAFAESFKGLISGSMSAQEALRNLFQRTADHFLDMAAQMIAKQIQMKILGIGLNILGNSVGSGFGQFGTNTTGVNTSFDIPVAPFQLAEGGYVTGPTNAVVGEGGEPEYIIPQSKMRESMERYSRGTRGSAVIPAAGDSGASGAGGGVAVAAPIDVRFKVERINNVDYVTAAEFQEGMQQAAKQGAQRGEQQAIKRLQMSSSTRRRVGL